MCPSPCDRSVASCISETSVVTVNWNGRHHLEHLLPSLTLLPCKEIILVDNASTDGSQDFIRQHYPQVRILQNQVNQGFAQPVNLGAGQAKGRYVAFINNDMRADERWLETAAARLTDTVPCVASRILDWEGEHIDFNGSSLQYLGYALQRDIGALAGEVSHDEKLLFPCGGAMLIDREVFLKLGGFDEDYFAIYEDVDLGWRLWVAGYEVAFAPDSLVYHRGHGTFRAHENEKMRYLMHRNALLTILKNYEEETFRKILPLAVLLAIKRAILLSGVEKESFYLWKETRQAAQASDPAAWFQITDALNQLVSLDDVLESLPRVLEKRAKIQALRRRSDAEIIELFKDPLRPIVENPVYVRQDLQYLELLDLGSLFNLSPYRRHLDGLPPLLREKIEGLENHLRGLQWLGTQALLHPQERSVSGMRQFLRRWRQTGLTAAWRRFVESVNRGI